MPKLAYTTARIGKWESGAVAILAAIRETHTIEPKATTGDLRA